MMQRIVIRVRESRNAGEALYWVLVNHSLIMITYIFAMKKALLISEGN
jgi:hypothetical protein